MVCHRSCMARAGDRGGGGVCKTLHCVHGIPDETCNHISFEGFNQLSDKKQFEKLFHSKRISIMLVAQSMKDTRLRKTTTVGWFLSCRLCCFPGKCTKSAHSATTLRVAP